MFAAVKRKLTALRNYRRVQKLWEEFQEISETGDVAEYSPKLNEFLESFQAGYAQYKEDSDSEALDKIFGDCTEVLLALLDWVSGIEDADDPEVNELIDKTLMVAEIILRDERYLSQVKAAPVVIGQAVSLLDKAHSTEGKRAVVHLLGNLGSDSSSTIQIGRNDGFRKMLRLLVESEEDLRTDILLTLRSFLAQQAPAAHAEHSPPSPKLGLPAKLTKIASGFAQLVFPSESSSKSDGLSAVDPPAASPQPLPLLLTHSAFPPTQDELVAVFTIINKSKKVETPTHSAGESSLSTDEVETKTHDSEVQDLLQDLMRVQGAFRAITDTLMQAALAVQLDLIETLHKLLLNNRRNQREFSKMQGYSFILQLLDETSDYSSLTTQQFLQSCFRIIHAIVLDSRTDARVGNVEAFQWLFHIIGHSIQPSVRLAALQCLQDILSGNVLNAAFVKHIGGIQVLLDIMEQNARFPCVCICRHKTQQDADHSLKVVARTDDLLKYIAVIMMNYDATIVHEYQRLLTTFPFPKPSVKTLILSSFAQMIMHFHSHGLEPIPDLIHTFSALFIRTASHLRHLAGINEPNYFRRLHSGGEEDSEIFSLELEPSEDAILSMSTPDDDVDIDLTVHVQGEQELEHAQPRPALSMSSPADISLEEGKASQFPHFVPSDSPNLCHYATSEYTDVHIVAEHLVYIIEIIAHGVLTAPRASTQLRYLWSMCHVRTFLSLVQNGMPFDVIEVVLLTFRKMCKLDAESRFTSQPSSAAAWAATDSQQGSDHLLQYLIWLLQEPSLSHQVRVQVLKAIVDFLQVDAGEPGEVDAAGYIMRSAFRKCGGVETTVALVTSPDPMVAQAAFIAFAESARNHHENKVYIGDQVGYAKLADIFRRANFDLDLWFFDVMMDVSTVTATPSPSAFEMRYLSSDVDLEDNADQAGPAGPPPSATDSQQGREMLELRRRLGERLPICDAALPLSSLHTATPTEWLEHLADLCLNRSAANADSKEEDVEHRLQATSKFRSTEAALLLVLLLPCADADVQREVITQLSVLLEANPSNKRALCDMDVLSLILRLYPRFPENVRNYWLQLVATLGTYDIQAKEVLLLFDLATLPAEKDNNDHWSEAQMQMLYAIGRIAERRAPDSYFNFDGVVSSLLLAPFTRFPKSSTGYTFSCWLRVHSFFGHESSLFTWQDARGDITFELCFAHSPEEPDGHGLAPGSRSGRFLALRTSPDEEPEQLSDMRFSENGDWHHLVLTHQKSGVRVYSDGKLLKELACSVYPSSVSKSSPLTGKVGCGAPESSATTSFCGTLSTIFFLEGCLSDKQIESLYARGMEADSNFKAMGIVNKRLLVVEPLNYTERTADRDADSPASKKPKLIVSASPPDSPHSPSTAIVLSPMFLESFSQRGREHSTKKARRSHSLSPSGYRASKSSSRSAKARGKKGERLGHRQSHSSEWQMPSVEAAVDVHHTSAIKDQIRAVGGVHMCLPFLTMGPSQQIAGLRILGLFIDRCQANMDEFVTSKGFYVLGHLLPGTNLTSETFDLLLDLTHGEMNVAASRRRFNNAAGLEVIVNLLRIADLRTRQHVTAVVADMVTMFEEAEFNTQVWYQQVGFFGTLDLLRLSPHLLEPLTNILLTLLPNSRIDEIETLLSFILSDDTQLLDEKARVSRTLRDAFSKYPLLIGHITKIGYEVLFLLLEGNQPESIRVDTIATLGLLFHGSSKWLYQFSKANGFDVLSYMLSQYEPSRHVCNALLDLACGAFQPRTEDEKTSESTETSINSVSVSAADRELEHPQVVRVLMDLLSRVRVKPTEEDVDPTGAGSAEEVKIADSDSNPDSLSSDYSFSKLADLHLHVLRDLTLLLQNTSNLNKIISSPDWVYWTRDYHAYLTSLTPAPTKNVADTESVLSDHDAAQLDAILERFQSLVQTIVMADICHKQAHTMRVKLMVDYPDFQILVMDRIVAHFHEHPSLEVKVTNTLRNLAQLYDCVDCIPIPAHLLTRMVHSVNLMASQSPSAVRSKMKDAGIFVVRESLVLHSVRGDFPTEERRHIFDRISFEMTDTQFRDGHGVLYILKMFHDTGDAELRHAIVEVLRSQLIFHDEHRKGVIKVLQNESVLRNLFPHIDPEEFLMLNPGICFAMPTDDSKEPALDRTASESTEDFLLWYFQDDEETTKLRQSIVERIDKTLSISDAAYKKARDKSKSKHLKSAKQTAERNSKTMAALKKTVSEHIEKVKTSKLSKLQKDYASARQSSVQHRLRLAEEGEKSWDLIVRNLIHQHRELQLNLHKNTDSTIDESKETALSEDTADGDAEGAAEEEQVEGRPDTPSASQAETNTAATTATIADTSHGSTNLPDTAGKPKAAGGDGRCPTCAYLPSSRWDYICHMRLDHHKQQ